MKAIFVDHGGALLVEHAEHTSPRQLTLRGGVGAGLRLLNRLDYRIFIIHQHACGGHGERAGSVANALADRLADLLFREELDLDGFYRCPLGPEPAPSRRTTDCDGHAALPSTLSLAAAEHGIDLCASWMIGTLLRDVEAGNRAGCRTLLIDNGDETAWRLGPHRVPTRLAPDLHAGALMIARHDAPP
jgi:D-glycero-D-manno-heptose 1,7-bisphosphate phosphatase